MDDDRRAELDAMLFEVTVGSARFTLKRGPAISLAREINASWGRWLALESALVFIDGPVTVMPLDQSGSPIPVGGGVNIFELLAIDLNGDLDS